MQGLNPIFGNRNTSGVNRLPDETSNERLEASECMPMCSSWKLRVRVVMCGGADNLHWVTFNVESCGGMLAGRKEEERERESA